MSCGTAPPLVAPCTYKRQVGAYCTWMQINMHWAYVKPLFCPLLQLKDLGQTLTYLIITFLLLWL